MMKTKGLPCAMSVTSPRLLGGGEAAGFAVNVGGLGSLTPIVGELIIRPGMKKKAYIFKE